MVRCDAERHAVRDVTRSAQNGDIAILILAGGEATRLPGKLMLDAGGVPLLARVYRNLVGEARTREVAIACNAMNRAGIAALLPVPTIVDRWPNRGPLGGMLTAMESLRAPWVFVAAGDAPFVDATFLQRLAAERHDDDECVVPQSGGAGLSTTLEPLAALYDRTALLREGSVVFHTGGGSIQGVIRRLRARVVTNIDARAFMNVNTPAEYRALRDAYDCRYEDYRCSATPP